MHRAVKFRRWVCSESVGVGISKLETCYKCAISYEIRPGGHLHANKGRQACRLSRKNRVELETVVYAYSKPMLRT